MLHKSLQMIPLFSTFSYFVHCPCLIRQTSSLHLAASSYFIQYKFLPLVPNGCLDVRPPLTCWLFEALWNLPFSLSLIRFCNRDTLFIICPKGLHYITIPGFQKAAQTLLELTHPHSYITTISHVVEPSLDNWM